MTKQKISQKGLKLALNIIVTVLQMVIRGLDVEEVKAAKGSSEKSKQEVK